MDARDYLAIYEIRRNLESGRELPEHVVAELSLELLRVVYDAKDRREELEEAQRLLELLQERAVYTDPVDPPTIVLEHCSYRIRSSAHREPN